MGSRLSIRKCIKARGGKQSPDLDLQQRPILSEDDRKIVRDSWILFHSQLAGGGAEKFVETIVETEEFELMAGVVAPVVGQLAMKLRAPFSFHAHFLFILDVLSFCMSNLDESLYVERRWHKLGMEHLERGVKSEEIQLMIPPFIAGMRISMGEEAWTSEVDTAWKNFFALIVYTIKEPMTRKRRQSLLTCRR